MSDSTVMTAGELLELTIEHGNGKCLETEIFTKGVGHKLIVRVNNLEFNVRTPRGEIRVVDIPVTKDKLIELIKEA